MKITLSETRASAPCAFKFIAAAAMLALLSSCGHHPPKDATVGEKFLGNWKIAAVYHDPGKSNEPAPISAGGNLAIVRDAKSSQTFRLETGDGFQGESTWNNLELKYKSGKDEDIAAPLISELTSERCSAQEDDSSRSGDNNDYNEIPFIEADVQYDFINLKGRGLELLESAPVIFGEEEHIVHIFRILRIGDKRPSLLIFYCKTSHCNHRGAAHAVN